MKFSNIYKLIYSVPHCYINNPIPPLNHPSAFPQVYLRNISEVRFLLIYIPVIINMDISKFRKTHFNAPKLLKIFSKMTIQKIHKSQEGNIQ